MNINNELRIKGLKLFQSLHIDGEVKNIRAAILRIRWLLISKNRAKILYISRPRIGIIHEPFLIPCYQKFNFLKEENYEIGPCFTRSEFCGQGIYTRVLKKIICDFSTVNNSFYILVALENKVSIRGVTKAGFIEAGRCRRTCFKRYIQ